ncbi:MAG: ParD-like family protein [Spirochaetaceae bacterium]|nr:ParD-like family protein [Spirochaetaceae bacterium]
MAQNAVRLSEEIMKAAINCAPLNSRSVPKQIEHWIKIGKIVEENPDLPYDFIKDAIEAKHEMERGDVSTFKFRKK